MGTTRNRPTPRTVAAALLRASADADEAALATARREGGSMGTDAEELQDVAAVSLACAIRMLAGLARSDHRFDFGAVYQALLEYLPILVVGGPDVTATALATASVQLHGIAASITDRTRPTPKPLDLTPAPEDANAAAQEDHLVSTLHDQKPQAICDVCARAPSTTTIRAMGRDLNYCGACEPPRL